MRSLIDAEQTLSLLPLDFRMGSGGGPIPKVIAECTRSLWETNPHPKAAIMRIGLLELKDFCLEFFPSTRAPTFLEESCGVADIMTSCACVDPKPTPQVVS